jgi:hypothetical protein
MIAASRVRRTGSRFVALLSVRSRRRWSTIASNVVRSSVSAGVRTLTTNPSELERTETNTAVADRGASIREPLCHSARSSPVSVRSASKSRKVKKNCAPAGSFKDMGEDELP